MGKKATDIQIKMAEYCDRSKRFLYNKRVVSARGGYPDVEIYDQLTGATYNFEVKAVGDRVSDIQQARIHQFNKYHLRAWVVETFEEFKQIIKEL